MYYVDNNPFAIMIFILDCGLSESYSIIATMEIVTSTSQEGFIKNLVTVHVSNENVDVKKET